MTLYATGVQYSGKEAGQGKGDGVLGVCNQSGSLKKVTAGQ